MWISLEPRVLVCGMYEVFEIKFKCNAKEAAAKGKEEEHEK